MEGDMNPAVDLAAVKRMAQEALDMGADSRNRSVTSLQYYHKKQLSSEERAALRKRKQPDIVINRIRPAVNGTLGVLQQGRTDPKAWPRTPQDQDGADVATKTLRYIADANEFDDIRIEAARDFLIQHGCAVILGADDKHRVKIEQIAPEELLFDARSRREDFRDARYLGIAKWLYADEVSALYQDKKGDIEATIDSAAPIPVDSALEDKPLNGQQSWIDRRRRRLLVIELYYREGGQWLRCVFHAGGILESGPSAYNDSDGKPSCPIVAQTCYVDDENVRYGVVFDMLDPQDEINKRRSKALHLLNTRQVRVGLSYAGDAEEARREASRPDGVLIGDKDDIEILPTQDMQIGNLNMLQEAKAEMERTGPNPAMLGRQGADSSGRALLARQQAGLVELAIVFSGHESWEKRVYRKAWEIARQYWKAPDFIRVTDDEGAPQFIGINQPIAGPPQVVAGPDGMAMIQPTVLGYDNALAEMDVDITLDSVPDTATIQQEQFETLVELAKLYGPQEVPFDDMLLLSSITDKHKILERRKQRQEEAAQGGQMAQQAQMAEVAAKVENTNTDTGLKQAQTEKIVVETHLNAFNTGYQAAQGPAQGAASL